MAGSSSLHASFDVGRGHMVLDLDLKRLSGKDFGMGEMEKWRRCERYKPLRKINRQPPYRGANSPNDKINHVSKFHDKYRLI